MRYLLIYLTFANIDDETQPSKNMGLQDSQAELLHLRKPSKTYNDKNSHEHNNTSWKQIRISAQETSPASTGLLNSVS